MNARELDQLLHGNGSTDPYLPVPDAFTGELKVDPNVHLRAKALDVDLAFYYSSLSDDDRQYGKARSLNVDCRVLSTVGGSVVTLVRGDFRKHVYSLVGSSGGITTYVETTEPPSSSTLIYDGRFVETFNDGLQMIYGEVAGTSPNLSLLLKRYQNPLGVGHTYSYLVDGADRYLQAIQEPAGRLVTFVYDSGSPTKLLNHVEDWTGRRWSFAYDDRQLTTYTSPLGCATKYAYSSAGGPSTIMLLHEIEDPRGYATSYLYDERRRTITMTAGTAVWDWDRSTTGQTVLTEPHGGKTTYQFDANGDLMLRLDPTGVVSAYAYQSRRPIRIDGVDGHVYSVSYDAAGRIVLVWLKTNHFTTFGYDGYGNLTTAVDPLGQVTTYAYSGATRLLESVADPLGRRTTLSYYGDGLVNTIKDPRGLVTTFAYDRWGNMTTLTASDGGVWRYGYDELNRRISVQLPMGPRVWTYGYDAGDNMVFAEDPDLNVTTYIYDSCLLQAVRDPFGFATTFAYGRFGNLLTEIDALGYRTSYGYDVMGLPVSVEDAMGHLGTIVYQAGTSRRQADIDALGNRTSYGYDIAGRLWSITDPLGRIATITNDQPASLVVDSYVNGYRRADGSYVTYVYDSLDRLVASVSPLDYRSTSVYDAASQLVSLVDPLGNTTHFYYDAAGNQTAMLDANGKVSTVAYYSNKNTPLSAIDPLGRRTTYSYDAMDWLRNLTDPAGGVLSMNYWNAGTLRWVLNQLNQTSRSYEYDQLQRVRKQNDASGGAVTFLYDAIGRTVGLWYSDNLRVTIQYDPLGRRTTMVDWTGTTTYAYDALSRLLGQSQPGGLNVGYGYDPVGNRTHMVDPDGGRFTYSHDALDRLMALQVPTGQFYTQQYDADSRRTTLLLGLGSKRQYRYDAASRLTTQIELNSSNQPIYTMVDSYDAVGNRTGRTTNGERTTWAYDDAYRLIRQERPGQWATFAYDSNDNLILKHHQGEHARTMSYDAAGRLAQVLQGANVTTFVWGQRGVMARVYENGTVKATYSHTDINNNLWVAEESGVRSTYQYDGDNLRRNLHNAQFGRATVVWDGADYLHFRPSVGSKRVFHVLEGEVVGESVGGTVEDYLLDSLGSVVGVLDSSQALTETFAYRPFGELAPGEFEPEWRPFLWVGGLGYFFDGLRHYVRARVYRPDFGSWNQLDPLWPNQPPFQYPVSPLDVVDPSGLQASYLPLLVRWPKPGKPQKPTDKNVVMMGDTFPGSQLFYHLVKPGIYRSDVELECPTKNQLRSQLVDCNSFWFYGHGDNAGRLYLAPFRNGDPDDCRLVPDDVAKIAAFRRRLGIPKMKYAYLGACDIAQNPEAINNWLRMAEVVYAYPYPTAEAWPPRLNIPHVYREPLPVQEASKCPPRTSTGGKKTEKKNW
ncbi:MAG: hypothetical protein KIS66_17575 [Fimbriimonadaceae bacterium]|nr:hypothetical protein [Fimbriimonadaceae bacterium]